MRLAKDDAPVAGRLDIPTALVNAHTAVGGLALVLWGAYLFFDVDWVVGFLGLALWWATTVIGLLILMRWVPAKGKHASEGAQGRVDRGAVALDARPPRGTGGGHRLDHVLRSWTSYA